MKNGKMVRAKSLPVEYDPNVGPSPEVVVGRLEITPVEFMGNKWNSALVYVKDRDGDMIPVEVDEETIQPAGRRESETVLP